VLGLLALVDAQIPTTLDGPFVPRTVAFDPSLRRGSSDLLPTDPRVVKTVVGNAPEQIALALSTPDAMWVTWITGNCFSTFIIVGAEAMHMKQGALNLEGVSIIIWSILRNLVRT